MVTGRMRWALVALAVVSGSSGWSTITRPHRGADRILVRWHGAPSAEGLQRAGAIHTRKQIPLSTVLPRNGETQEQALSRLRKDPKVMYAEPNYRRRILTLAPPNEPTWGVKDPQPDYITRMLELEVPPEGQENYTWALELINALGAWNVYPGTYYTAATLPTQPIKVAVIDTGCDLSHPDWINVGGTGTSRANGGQIDMANAKDFTVRDAQGRPTMLLGDPVGHGTFTAGIIGAAANNGGAPGEGAIGLAYGVEIMPLMVLDNAAEGNVEDVIDAILYAVDHGASVINLSLGDYDYSVAEQDAINYAWENGVLVVAAAGNDGDTANGGLNRVTYPAADNHVLAVGATDPYDNVATYSNTGLYVGVTAPGGDAVYAGLEDEFFGELPTQFGVWSLMPTTDFELQYQLGIEVLKTYYDYSPGTSAASPLVAGLAALYIQKNNLPRTTASVIRTWQAIQRGAEDIYSGAGEYTVQAGFGRINAEATLLDQNTRFTNSGCVVGKLTNNGVPVENAPVTATRGSFTKTATTRKDGGYRIANLPAGVYTVTASGVTATGSQSVTVVAGADVPGVNFFLPWPSGDVDHNGRVDLRDAVSVLRMVQGLDPLDPAATTRADVFPWIGTGGRLHGDGSLTLDDVRLITRLTGGLDF